jgi:hypothetical protein
MNDPGLGEPISSDAKDVENQLHDEHDKREEEEQAFLDPRYSLLTIFASITNIILKVAGGLRAQHFPSSLVHLDPWHQLLVFVR